MHTSKPPRINYKTAIALAYILILIFCFSFVGCSSKGGSNVEETLSMVASINANSDFGKHHLFEEIAILSENYDINQAPYTVTLKDGFNSYATANRYPHSASELSLTQINILEDSFNILGIAVGQETEKAESILLANSFSRIELTGDYAPYKTAFPNGILFMYSDVRIVVISDDNKVVEIFVNLVDPNKSKVNGAH